MTVKILKGKPVSDAISKRSSEKTKVLKVQGIIPTLAVIRLGEDPGDKAYENSLLKRASETGVEVERIILEKEITQEQLEQEIRRLDRDDKIHGVLIFRPLPAHIDEKAVSGLLSPEKDVDGITPGSMAGVFTDSDRGYPPCTAEACMKMLDHYGYGLKGKRVTVFGRSLVVGKPAAMMAMRRQATVTVCHSRTTPEDLKEAGRNADIIIAAVGRSKMIDKEHVGNDQVIIDVGTNVDDNGRMCGDVDFDNVSGQAAAITPVPGGVGNVTTAVLMEHVIDAAEKTL